jgi:hypothetical protein
MIKVWHTTKEVPDAYKNEKKGTGLQPTEHAQKARQRNAG